MNLWGLLPLALLVVAAVALVWVADRQTCRRMGRALMVVLAQLALVGGYVWVLRLTSGVWADLLWLVAMAAVAAWLSLGRRRPVAVRRWLSIAGALLVACALPALCIAIALPGRVFVPVAGVLMGPVALTTAKALQAYEGSISHTQAHIRFLMANGASRLESLTPSFRRALRAAVVAVVKRLLTPVVVAMPPLTGGLLIGGASVGAAVGVSLLFVAALLSASVLATAILLSIAYRYERALA